jgi:hypothetical protein
MEAMMAGVEGKSELALEDLQCVFATQSTKETRKTYPPGLSTRLHAVADAYHSFSLDKAFAHLDMKSYLLEVIFFSAARVGAYTLCQSMIPEMPPEQLEAFCTINNGGYGIEEGSTALDFMSSHRWDDVGHDPNKALHTIKLLLPRLSDASIKQDCFYLTAKNSSPEIFALFLEDVEVDVNQASAKDNMGTVLHVAIRAKRPDHCRLILKSTRFNAADAKDGYGLNALMVAA